MNGPYAGCARSGRMGTSAQTLENRLASSADAVAGLPVAVFVERWRLITGEPPAILLSSYTLMLALLVESTPAAPFDPRGSTWDSRPGITDTAW